MAETKKVALMDKEMVYSVGEEEVKLTANIVRNYIAKGNKQITDREAIVFMNLCKYRKLNPFLNEAYIVKFGEEAQIVAGKEAVMRKAEESPRYKGHRAGIIVIRNKEPLELEGCFKLPTDTLVGGWAQVFVEGKDHPVVAKVALSEYSKNQSTWKTMPSTMIRKVALVQALREAFPTEVGMMYSSEELGVNENKIKDTHMEAKEEINEQANQEVIDVDEVIPVKETNEVNKDEVKENKTETIDAEIVQEENDEEAPY